MVNRKIWIVCLLVLPQFLWAQQAQKLSLQEAYDLAQKNYPVIRQKQLVLQTADLTMENLSKGYLPQLSLNGQATYQSDVTSIKGSIIPGVNIQSPPRDQYRFTADLNQVIFDGGLIKQQRLSQELNAGVEAQKVEVELYQLKDRVNQLYFGILYMDEQLRQVGLVRADIETGIKRVEAQLRNGTAFRSNLDMLKAELLKNDQRAIELRASRKGLLNTLALFIARPLGENTQLERPVSPGELSADLQRPELKLYDKQVELFDQQNNLVHSKILPKASLFVQGGYGQPGLNMLDNSFAFFYQGGLRLNWSIGEFYTQKRDKELIKVNQQIVDVQRETFLLNTNTQLVQQRSDIDKLEQLIASDNAIIDLRASVKEAAKAQLENGVITANDYLEQVNAEDQARQAQIAHRLLLLQAKINYQTISGK